MAAYDENGNPISDWAFENYYNPSGYAGLGYDIDQWNKRMDAQSAAEDALRLKTQYSGGSRPSTISYGSPAQYAASQPMALQINSLPKLSLTAPQYKPWDASAEQAEVYKAASPMIRENRRNADALRAALSGLDPTMRRLQQKDIIQGYGDALSKTYGTANQIGGQRYINKLNYDNQQAAQDAQIANQMSLADYAQKMNAIGYNAGLGEDANNRRKYRYTDYV